MFLSFPMFTESPITPQQLDADYSGHSPALAARTLISAALSRLTSTCSQHPSRFAWTEPSCHETYVGGAMSDKGEPGRQQQGRGRSKRLPH